MERHVSKKEKLEKMCLSKKLWKYKDVKMMIKKFTSQVLNHQTNLEKVWKYRIDTKISLLNLKIVRTLTFSKFHNYQITQLMLKWLKAYKDCHIEKCQLKVYSIKIVRIKK